MSAWIANNLSATDAKNVMLGLEDDKSWQDRSNCLGEDPDLFFPEDVETKRMAKAICQACEVQVECLDYALAHNEKFGIWGGLTERERRRVSQQRAIARRAMSTSFE